MVERCTIVLYVQLWRVTSSRLEEDAVMAASKTAAISQEEA